MALLLPPLAVLSFLFFGREISPDYCSLLKINYPRLDNYLRWDHFVIEGSRGLNNCAFWSRERRRSHLVFLEPSLASS